MAEQVILFYHWAVTSSPSGSIYAFSSNDTTGASATTQLTFNTLGTYSGTLTVTDHDGSGLATQVTWTTNGTQIRPIDIEPNAPAQVATGNSATFTAYVCDQLNRSLQLFVNAFDRRSISGLVHCIWRRQSIVFQWNNSNT